MSEPLLKAEDLHVRFSVARGIKGLFADRERRTIDAVAGVSLEIREGECLAIVGESGSGKTTLARALNGLTPIAGGKAWFAGGPLHENANWPAVRRQTVMIFQDPVGSLSPRMTVRSLILEPFRIHGIAIGEPAQKARELLAAAGLSQEFLDRYPHQLSGGQARRVGVARALALNPALLLADEPTAGLDVSVQGEILTLLNKLRGELGLAMLIITHNLNIIRHVADRIGVMYLGRLVETGPVEEVFASPAHPYTRTLLAANPEPDPNAKLERIALKGEVPSLLARPKGCEFHPRCPWSREDCAARAPDLAPVAGREQCKARCLYPFSTGETPGE
ncbi:ABC transporter ATP-binding protein [Rhizobiales bacterium]|uniref:oligopeptide/dipeptide ABC transporter ATP-binding protein n=1 Tax=Hongsoonwoonella zoysiae TaxID=2821844 RepID=UPI00155F9A19|nr:ABC transporter ATP-binding protein [Hongsoonwoonella zoysiae]NRG20003.1 ABC transporter ATP-binding protein [Hongsoonwoonella zoysiae]